jgi:paraquat-inducible protein B
MSAQDHSRKTLEHLPRARIEKNWKTRLFWLAPIVAALLAAWFVYSNLFSEGPGLHIYFENARGLEATKSQVKYRDAEIGTVDSITLTKDHQHVDVAVKLKKSAADLAREGSQFWIVRPEVGVGEIRGLQTIVSGSYIAVEPGEGKPQTQFTGLMEPPVLEQKREALKITLIAERLGSLKERAPVFYRDIQVGQIAKTELGPESQTVRITVEIEKHYAPLVRLNSRFWNAGGVNVSIGLNGASISAQSVQTLVSGGVAFATPDLSEKEAPPDSAFRLYDKPEETWLAWSPKIQLPENNNKTSEENTNPNVMQ